MKLSLRNLALASAVMVAGAAFAQDAPTVTQKWIQHLGIVSGDFRTGTGVNGKVYMSGGSIIKVVDETGIKDVEFEGLTFNKGMSSDDAGNLFVLKGWPTGAGTNAAYLIKPDLKTVAEVAVKAPTEDASYPIGRSDVQGGAIGDFFSEEGGALYIASQNSEYPICVMYKNGEPVEIEYATEARMAAANTMASAVPSVSTVADLEDSPENLFYYRTGSSSANIYYINEDGEAATLKVPAAPEGYALSTQNGFTVFTLGDVTYQVRPLHRAGFNWGSDFLISDLEGNVLFATSYADEYVSLGSKTGNGCNLVAHKVSDYKVELYQIYTTTENDKIAFAAQYDITLPEPPAEPKTTDRSQFVYNLKAAQAGNNVFTVTFEATGDAASATLVLTDKATDESVYVDLKGEVKKGENTFSVDLNDYAKENGKFNYAIELHNYEIPEDVVTEPVSIGGSRGGVVCMVDPTNEFYGMTVVARTKNGGFDVYNQLGEKVMDAVHANNAAMGGTGANNSSPMRGRQRGTTAQFASWGDAACGVVAFDLAKPDDAPYCVFEGKNTGNGTIMNVVGNDTILVGSGTPGMAYAGEGEGTILFTFDEDIFGNKLAGNPIGTAMTTGKAAVNWGFGSAMANTNVGLLGTKGGLFFSQTRANGMETGVCGLGYIDITDGVDGADIIWRSADEAEQYPEFLKSATGGIDINPAGDLFAVSTYTGINVYLLSWDGNKPVFEPYKVIDTPNQKSVYTTVRFDAGNNLHVINQTTGYYQVIMADKEPISVTEGNGVLDITTGVDNVAVDVEAADAVYYNLNGVKVDANNLTPGVYVKVAGKVATKVVVK